MDGLVSTWVANLAAVLLAAVFLYAAVAKLGNRSATISDFVSLGLPRAEIWAIAVPAAELITAATLVIVPGWGGVLAFTLLAAFTTSLVLVIRSGRVATCACFGGASTEPISTRHLIRNGVLLAMALIAATSEGWF